MINVGIIGYGKMGAIRHNVISKYKNINVILIYDPEDINSEIETVQTPDEIINNPKIDAIYICTPNYLNKMLTIQSLKAGKHVYFVRSLQLLLQKMLKKYVLLKNNWESFNVWT